MRIAEWTSGEREAPEPYEGNVVAAITVGTLVWAALFVGQLPFYGWLRDHGHESWLWTCLVGFGGGLLGVWYVRRREAAIRTSRGSGPRGEGQAS